MEEKDNGSNDNDNENSLNIGGHNLRGRAKYIENVNKMNQNQHLVSKSIRMRKAIKDKKNEVGDNFTSLLGDHITLPFKSENDTNEGFIPLAMSFIKEGNNTDTDAPGKDAPYYTSVAYHNDTRIHYENGKIFFHRNEKAYDLTLTVWSALAEKDAILFDCYNNFINQNVTETDYGNEVPKGSIVSISNDTDIVAPTYVVTEVVGPSKAVSWQRDDIKAFKVVLLNDKKLGETGDLAQSMIMDKELSVSVNDIDDIEYDPNEHKESNQSTMQIIIQNVGMRKTISKLSINNNVLEKERKEVVNLVLQVLKRKLKGKVGRMTVEADKRIFIGKVSIDIFENAIVPMFRRFENLDSDLHYNNDSRSIDFSGMGYFILTKAMGKKNVRKTISKKEEYRICKASWTLMKGSHNWYWTVSTAQAKKTIDGRWLMITSNNR